MSRGRLKTRKWQGLEGKDDQITFKITNTEMLLLGSRSRSDFDCMDDYMTL